MDNQLKTKRLTFLTINIVFLLNGVEYGVILPTIWRYLQSLDAAPYFLGLTLSAFSLSGLLSGLVFGHWSDRTQSTKKIILFANVFEIVGNVMYFVGYSKWLILSSRFVAGMGAGVNSAIFGFLTRVTSPVDRSTVFAGVMACRQAGLLIGPAFNLFLRLCDFQLGVFVVDKYTAPGLFMCVLWLLLQLAVLLLYTDLPPLEKQKAQDSSLNNSRNSEKEQEDVEDEDCNDEEKPLMVSPELVGSYGSVTTSQQLENGGSSLPKNTTDHHSPPPSPVTKEFQESCNPFKNFSLTREFMREEVVVLLAAQFIILFNQTVLETMVTPLTQNYFDFGELENSIMYFLAGTVMIGGFLFVRWLSRHVEERGVFAIGLSICNIACVWFLIFLVKPIGSYAWRMTEFVFGLFLQVLGWPFVSVAQVSLFSKLTNEKTQGFSHGVRRSVGGLATILGPLWAGSLTDDMYVMMGVMMGLMVLLTVSGKCQLNDFICKEMLAMFCPNW
uniref:Uncharacterized LOC114461822 n=1 Tax=Gouania willdenowi TaxID=441366 RepID=A0A8C5DVB6_GOUWI